jgi:hypothetical protein
MSLLTQVPFSSLPRHLLAHALWLHVVLSDHLDAAVIEAFQQRLRFFASRLGLLAVNSLDRLTVIPTRGPLDDFDRGLLVGWLLGQPECVFVQVESCPAVGRPSVMH